MSSLSENNENSSRESRTSVLSWFAFRYALIFFAACCLIFVVGSYLQRSSIENLFSFQGNDVPGPLPSEFEFPKALGVHYFSDFLWSYAYVKHGYPSGYGGTSLLLIKCLSLFPYWIATSIFMSLSIGLFLFSVYKLVDRFLPPHQVSIVLFLSCASFPFLTSVDRGQMQLLQTSLVMLAFSLFEQSSRDQRRKGILLMAMAITIKGTPIILLALLLRRKQIRSAISAALLSIPLGLLPLLLFPGGIGGGLSFIREHLNYLRTQGYVESNLAYNNGIRGLLQSFQTLQVPYLDAVSTFVLSNILVCLILLGIAVGLTMLFGRMTDIENAFMAASFSYLFIDLAGGYTLLLLTLPMVLLVRSLNMSSLTRLETCIMWALPVLLAPKGIPVLFATSVFQRNTPTFNSLINPLVGFAILICCITTAISRLMLDRIPLSIASSPLRERAVD